MQVDQEGQSQGDQLNDDNSSSNKVRWSLYHTDNNPAASLKHIVYRCVSSLSDMMNKMVCIYIHVYTADVSVV